MSLLARAAIVGVVLFGVQALAVAVIAAVRRHGNIYATIILVACATAPVVFLAGASIVGSPLSTEGRVYLALMHLSLGGFLFHFMTLPDRSVTLRIFVELLSAPDRTLSLAALDSRYGVRTMIDSRLQQLEGGRFLSIRPDGAITLLPRGLRFGRFVTAGRRLFNIKSAN
jgi:hypothetical protein